ncbi:OmpA family protein [Roseateles asaccharophilus]|uniref:Flagellar motor protein MotB n=1 Tax=Roseateles asaccharophilus TaxID=582607 RepID=A0ABU2AD62_9BURK|nr:OmpA family protein [Roseateles asaccharophilus]MDR7335139.1 flagellar motor protein MotB [Roseateles asaccharophilus]
MDEPLEIEQEGVGTPAWAAFGDLMAGVLGAFVLVLAAALVGQLDLANQLKAEVEQRQAEQARREALERALAGPLADGRITLVEGRIGISGAVLFATGSDQLHADGRALIKSLATPLRTYLAQRDEILMVSGFTDDRALVKGMAFTDNWELSAQRALNVARALMAEGLPPDAVFAAAFGPQQPVASNDDAAGRALNRRVEIAPTPRPKRALAASAP